MVTKLQPRRFFVSSVAYRNCRITTSVEGVDGGSQNAAIWRWWDLSSMVAWRSAVRRMTGKRCEVCQREDGCQARRGPGGWSSFIKRQNRAGTYGRCAMSPDEYQQKHEDWHKSGGIDLLARRRASESRVDIMARLQDGQGKLA